MSSDKPIDPIPASAYPKLWPVATPAPAMPLAWAGVALLQPFSPPLAAGPQPDLPFFQLCIGRFAYVQGEFLSAQIAGRDQGRWWYLVTRSGTTLSRDGGLTWAPVDMGWVLPDNWFGERAALARCAGASPLNWMSSQPVDWWKVPVPQPAPLPPAATWMWFDSGNQAPVRMMFGFGPPTPALGDPTQLAVFQMYSFSYMAEFQAFDAQAAPARPAMWVEPTIAGLQWGNPQGFKPFVFGANFGFTALMTPVNEQYNPLPTRVLYVWKPDAEYRLSSDRAQSTLMKFTYNPDQPSDPKTQEEALLTGPAPAHMPPPPDSGSGFLIDTHPDGSQSCMDGSQFPFPQEPPDWVSVPEVQATVQATIVDHPLLAPGQTVLVYSVLFPPALPNYPEATYLWTWYSPLAGSDGTQSRPVTFMQSQSGVGLGTSLALADYYDHQDFSEPINPANFAVPAVCAPLSSAVAAVQAA